MPDRGLADRIDAALAAGLPAAVALRRRLHADPYRSGQEGPTREAALAALGWGPGEAVASTGALVVPRVGSVVLRAELDGLPVTEATGVPWSATGDTMHACGHDVHLAGAIAAARAIASCEPPIPVGVLFQPREEQAPSGGKDVVASGILTRHDVRAVVAAHVQPQLPDGVVNLTAGVVNASVDEFEIVVRGRGGHGGYPQTVRDPVLAAAAIVLALQQLVARRVDPVRGAVCTIGRIDAGTVANVIPDQATLLGTLRAMDPGDRAILMSALDEIVEATAVAYGCTAGVIRLGGEPAVSNDPALATLAAAELSAAGIATDTAWRSFGSDDFSYYGRERPALMAFVGVDGGAGLHEPRFLPPESTVGLVARTLVAAYLAATELDG